MIRRLRIENFRCFQEAELALGPLNVLVGPNDSGKSTILEALAYLGRMVAHPPPKDNRQKPADAPEPVELIVRNRDRALEVRFELEGELTGGCSFAHELVLQPGPDAGSAAARNFESLTTDGHRWVVAQSSRPDEFDIWHPGNGGQEKLFTKGGQATMVLQKWKGSEKPVHAPLRTLADAYRSLAIYRFEPRSLRRPGARGRVLAPAGENLPSALEALLKGPDRSRFTELEAELQRILPTVKGIYFEGEEAPELFFKLASGGSIPADLASDGLLLFLAYLTLAYQSTPPLALLIEEPENGLHPHRVGEVVALLRELVAQPGRQVILTTHSPILLNHLEPGEIFVCQRGTDGWAHVTPFAETRDLDTLLEDFDVGELWYNLGEKRLVPDAG